MAPVLRTLAMWHPVAFYVLLTISDRFQSPYEYEVYSSAQLSNRQISYIYAAGAVAASLADIFGRALARRVGWRFSGALLLLLMIHSAMMKHATDTTSLVSSKVFYKTALITIYPLAVHQFHPLSSPGEMGVLLIIGAIGMTGGFVGSILCEVVYYPPTRMFSISTVFLVITFTFHWLGTKTQPIKPLTMATTEDRKISGASRVVNFAFWTTSTVVEMYWTPLCRGGGLQVGNIYAILCLSHVLGNMFFKVLQLQATTYRYSLTLATVLATVGMFFCFAGTYVYVRGTLVFIMALVTYHFALGLQGAVMRQLRSVTFVSPLSEACARGLGRLAGLGLILMSDLSDVTSRMVFLVCWAVTGVAVLLVQGLAGWKLTASKGKLAKASK